MHSNFHYLRHRRGFTLMETLLSATLVSSTLLTVIALFSTGLNISRTSSKTTSSSLLARRIMEEVRLEIHSATAAQDSHQTSATNEAKNADILPLSVFTSSLTPVHLTSEDAEESSPSSLTTAHPHYHEGFPQLEASFLATWFTKDRSDVSPGCKLIVVTIESPAAHPANQRKVFHYTTLVHPHALPPL